MSKGNLHFLENKGQMEDLQRKPVNELLFKASGSGVDMYITTWGLSYVFTKTEKQVKPQLDNSTSLPDRSAHNRESKQILYDRADMELVGADIKKENIVREYENEDLTDYYLSHCPQGIRNVHSYERITVKNIYPGIDWVLYQKNQESGFGKCEAFINSNGDKGKDANNKDLKNEQGLKYDFVVHPGADPSQIKLRYKWTDKPSLQKDGSIKISTPMGDIVEGIPVSYGQNKERNIITRYVIHGNEIGFILDNYPKDEQLTIDPELTWATYYGGNIDSEPSSINSDGIHVWVIVAISNFGFPTMNSGGTAYFQANYLPGGDFLILEFGTTCGQPIWASYYSGGYANVVNSYSIFSDQVNVWVTGITGAGFPTQAATGGPGVYNQATLAAGATTNAFILQFNCTTNARIWATYYGGSGIDVGNSISSDGVNVWVTGKAGAGFPTQAAIGAGPGVYNQATLAAGATTNAFILQFNCTTHAREWATYYGGSGGDVGNSISTDGVNVWVTGTAGAGFPTQAAISGAPGVYNQAALAVGGTTNAFILQFNCTTNERIWATYYGGSGGNGDQGNSISSDGANVWVTGQTSSANFPIQAGGGYNQPALGGTKNLFILQFDCASSERKWATYYGGSGLDNGMSIQSDGTNVWLCGASTSADFPTMKPSCGFFQGSLAGGSQEVFILQFNTSGVRQWATFYGIDLEDDWSIISSDGVNVFITGDAAEMNTYPIRNITGAYFEGTNTLGGGGPGENTFIGKFKILCPSPPVLSAAGGNSICPGGSVTLTASGADSYSWSPSAGLSSTSGSPVSASPSSNTTYTVMGISNIGCGSTDTATATITVTISPLPPLSVTSGPPLTCNTSSAALTGLSAGNTMVWNGGVLVNAPNPATVTTAGIYTVIATDVADGCTAATTDTVNAVPLPTVTVLKASNTCKGETNGAITLSSSGIGDTYGWSDWGTGLMVTGLTATNLDTGEYTVTVKDIYGCTATTAVSITLLPDPVVTAGTNATITEGEQVQLMASGGAIYLWTPSGSLNNAGIDNPIATPDQTTKYLVTVTDASGCSAIDSVLITVIGCEASRVFIPTAFSPNGDGKNDVLYVRGALCATQFHLQLFDRWGEQVFETTDPAAGWNGTCHGKAMETAVFVYYVRATLSNGESIDRKGNITLLR